MTLTARALLATVRANPADTTARLVYADALEEAGDEEDAHLQRAIAEPDNDGHRLALADALERTGGDVECEKCVDGMRWIGPGNIVECRQCSGAGRVSDGRAELAAFIMVQVELAKIPPGRGGPSPANTIRMVELQARELELWGYLPTRNGVRSFFESTLPGAAFCPESDGGKHLGSGFPIVIVSGGLPSVVRCTLAEWMGGECATCGGSGNGIVFSDGKPHKDCQQCHGTGRTPGIGPRLAQAWPVERVEVTDAVIHRSGGNDTYYVGGLGRFPKEFWRALEGHRTASAARDALSAASIQWARSQVI